MTCGNQQFWAVIKREMPTGPVSPVGVSLAFINMQHDDAGSDDNFESDSDRLTTPQLEQRFTAPPRGVDPEECASKTPAATRRRQPRTNQTQVRSPAHTADLPLLTCHCDDYNLFTYSTRAIG